MRAPAPIAEVCSCNTNHLPALDGWRAASILLVLGAHMLPLGPKPLAMNHAAGLAGMSLFFTLSGFLITAKLYQRVDVWRFMVSRGTRILPAAALFLVGVTVLSLLEPSELLPFIGFYANYDTGGLNPATAHFWSLCVEMQFYAFVGLLVWVMGRRGLLLLPVLAIAVTGLRVWAGKWSGIQTHYRVDEILAGAGLALLYAHPAAHRLRASLARLSPWLILPAFALACHRAGGGMNYARPYLAAALVGSTLLAPHTRLARLMAARRWRYLAHVSYALYLWHPVSMAGWLGEGETVARYLKRPLCFALSFAAAHVSTFFIEQPVMRAVKSRLLKRPLRRRPVLRHGRSALTFARGRQPAMGSAAPAPASPAPSPNGW